LAFAVFLAAVSAVQAGVNTWTGGQPAKGPDANAGLMATDPRDPYVVYAVFQPSLYQSRDGGKSWTLLASFVRIHSLLVHPAAPDTLYMGVTAGLQGELEGLVKSSDGGFTWVMQQFEPGIYWGPAHALAGSPTDANTVYGGAWTGLFKTTDGGNSWHRSSDLTAAIASLVVSPRDPLDVYVGMEADYYYFGFGAFARSLDGGITWSDVDLGPLDSVSAIAVDPDAESRVFVGLAGSPDIVETGVRRSDDGGGTFIRADEGLPPGESVSALVVDPANPSTLYAGTPSGVYRSRDFGLHWSNFSQLLSGEGVGSLAISADGRRLHASTHSNAYHIELASGPVDVAATPGGGARVLRWDSDRLGIQTVDGSNNWTATAFSATSETWIGIAIASAADGTSRVLWQNGDGRSAIEILSASGESASTVFGRSDGIPSDVAVGADGSVRLLWTNSAGAMHIRSIGVDGSERHGPQYGPTPGWSAVAIDIDSQGRAWVLWRSADGRGAVSVHVDGTLTTTMKWGATDGWWVEDLGAGADGRACVLARNVSGGMQVWRVGEDGSRSVSATHQSPGLVPRRIAAGADGLTRVLWVGEHGAGAVWLFDGNGNLVSTHDIPVPPVSVAGDWFGTFDSIDFFDCDLGVQASATFTQEGSTVDGVLNAEESGCGAIGVTFHGTLSEDQIHRTILQGTVTGGTGVYRFSPGSTATGVLSGSTLDLALFENSPGALPIPGGHMRLHRR
jgi:hypothetical protein